MVWLTFNLNELNRICRAISALSGEKSKSVTQVINLCKEQVMHGTFPDHKKNIYACRKLGLIEGIGDNVRLTGIGKKFHNLATSNDFELNDEQKELLVLECILNGEASSETEAVLKQFKPSYSERTFVWNSENMKQLSVDSEYVDLLTQVGLLRNDDWGKRVSSKYLSLSARVRRRSQSKTPQELAKDLENSTETGDIAENFVLDYEKKRLRSIGCEIEANLVQRVSELDVGAGYDIVSFDNAAEGLVYDRFIEVKGSTTSKLRFYWSRNEIEVAKELGPKYWIYFVGGVNSKDKSAECEPITIQNPYDDILQNRNYKTNCELISVRCDEGR